MPPKYFAEMLCDRIAASKIYLKDKYAKTDKEGMNPKSCELLEYFLTMLKEKGEKQTLKELKKFVKENK